MKRIIIKVAELSHMYHIVNEDLNVHIINTAAEQSNVYFIIPGGRRTEKSHVKLGNCAKVLHLIDC